MEVGHKKPFVVQDWDVYRHGLTGRVYYHNCVEGISQWKPPRKAKETFHVSFLFGVTNGPRLK